MAMDIAVDEVEVVQGMIMDAILTLAETTIQGIQNTCVWFLLSRNLMWRVEQAAVHFEPSRSPQRNWRQHSFYFCHHNNDQILTAQ